MKLKVGDYVRKWDGARFEGEVRAVYQNRKGFWMAVVEITGGPFEGMQHIYRQDQLAVSEPSEWFKAGTKEG